MAMDQSALLELIEVLNNGAGEQKMLRLLTRALQQLIDAETTAHIGAERHERTATRITQRDGFRDKIVTTGIGDVGVKLAKLRTGSFFPSLLEPRRDVALHAVIMQAYIEGVSTRRVELSAISSRRPIIRPWARPT